MNETEQKLIEKFVIRSRQDRYFALLSTAKARSKFTRELYHFKDFNWDLFQEISGSENEREIVAAKVRRNKALTCYAISVSPDFDGRYFPAAEAIENVIGTEGTILVFGSAEVVYYEGEEPGSRFISI